MSRKKKPILPRPTAVPASAPALYWIPTFVLWGVASFVIANSLRAHNYVATALPAQDHALNGLSMACFGLAILLAVIPSFRAGAVRHLEGLSSATPRRHALWIAAAYGGIWAWLGFIRYCEYRGYMLPLDTAVSVNEAYNFIHYGKLYMSVFGVHPLSIHFNLLRQMLSPVLLLWNHPLAMIFLEDAFLFTAPIAAYCLVFSKTKSSHAGFCGFLLTISTPYFFELVTSNLNVSVVAVLFPWAMFFFDQKLWGPTGFLMLAMVVSPEAMPLAFFGLGLYFIFDLGWDKLRSWKIGLTVCAISVAWWLADMAAIHHFAGTAAINFSEGYWELFRDFVPPGTPAARIPAEMISHPLRDIALLFSSWFKFYHVLRVLFYMGFVCLATPAAMLPFWTIVFPHILAVPPVTFTPTMLLQLRPQLGFADFDLHEGAYMFAPLLWATALGIKRIHDRLSARGRQGWLLVWVFLIAGFGFKFAKRTIVPDWRFSWFDGIPRAMARIPPGARLWVDDCASAPVSNRRWIKIISRGPDWPGGFESNLFKADYALLDKSFVLFAKPPYRDQMLTYFGQNGYRKIFDDNGLVVLQSPDPSVAPEEVPTKWVTMPQPDIKTAQAYARYLFQNMGGDLSTSENVRQRAYASAANAEGLALAGQGKFDEAIRQFELALSAFPDSPDTDNNWGTVLARQGKLPAAVQHFRQALKINPEYGPAKSNLEAALKLNK